LNFNQLIHYFYQCEKLPDLPLRHEHAVEELNQALIQLNLDENVLEVSLNQAPWDWSLAIE